MKKTFCIFIVLISIESLLHAQQSGNPFEIVDRLEVVDDAPFNTVAVVDSSLTNSIVVEDTNALEDIAASTVNEDEIKSIPSTVAEEMLADSNNPFEILARTPKAALTDVNPSLVVVEKNDGVEISEPMVREKPSGKRDRFLEDIQPAGKADKEQQQGQFFGLMLLTLIPVTVLFMIFRAFFGRAYENIINASTLSRSYREYAGASVIPLNIWHLVFLLNLGVFASLLMNHYAVAFTQQPLVNALICIALVSLLIFAKRIFLAFLGEIFPFKKEMQLYRYLMLLFGIMTGIFLAPINIALIYASPNVLKALIYGSLFVLLALYLVRSYRALVIGNRFLVLDRFHFLLYICAVEIAPIVILVKLGSIYLS
ncbi:MAG: DUF4271 domain-containing protein [Bacteroidota bacterium]